MKAKKQLEQLKSGKKDRILQHVFDQYLTYIVYEFNEFWFERYVQVDNQLKLYCVECITEDTAIFSLT